MSKNTKTQTAKKTEAEQFANLMAIAESKPEAVKQKAKAAIAGLIDSAQQIKADAAEASAELRAKKAPKSKILKADDGQGVEIKSVTTLDAGNGLLVEVIETAEREDSPVAKKPPVPKKKASEPEKIEAPKEPAQPTLRTPQVRVLAFLAKQKKPVTRKQISEGAPVDVAWCTEYLGSDNDAKRLANDAKHFPSLITLGYITATPGETDDKPVTTYTITDAGRAAVKNAK